MLELGRLVLSYHVLPRLFPGVIDGPQRPFEPRGHMQQPALFGAVLEHEVELTARNQRHEVLAGAGVNIQLMRLAAIEVVEVIENGFADGSFATGHKSDECGIVSADGFPKPAANGFPLCRDALSCKAGGMGRARNLECADMSALWDRATCRPGESGGRSTAGNLPPQSKTDLVPDLRRAAQTLLIACANIAPVIARYLVNRVSTRSVYDVYAGKFDGEVGAGRFF